MITVTLCITYIISFASTAIPHIQVHPKPELCRADERQKIVLFCLATGLMPIIYKWEKYQSSTDNWIVPSHRAVDVTSPKLIFSVITEEDEGIYRCVATNDDGVAKSGNATLTVFGEYSTCTQVFW